MLETTPGVNPGLDLSVKADNAKTEEHVRMTKLVINYVSLGYSARVVLGLEKSRTKSRLLNIIVFACEGIKKTTVRRSPPAQRYLDSIVSDLGTVASSTKGSENPFDGAVNE